MISFFKKLLRYRFLYKKRLIKKIASKTNGITLLDVGAAGGIQSRWNNISNNINYIGIEPDLRSEIDLEACKSKKILNSIFWNERKTIDFYLCRKPMVSSCLPPNNEFLRKFSKPSRFDIVKKLRVESSTIDHELLNEEIDFVKVDIQGGELYCLKGIQNKLNFCLGLEVEISFHQIYKNQPLFGEVDSFLYSKDFEFIDFLTLKRAERDIYSHDSFGQCLWGDGLWLRTPEYIASKLKYKVLEYLTICALYGRYDLALKAIDLTDFNISKEVNIILNKLRDLQNRCKRNKSLLNRLNKILSMESEHNIHILY